MAIGIAPKDLAAAQNIQGYIRHFLTNSDGAFYVGQGGDVEEAIQFTTDFK
jgi:hypothetical protein